MQEVLFKPEEYETPKIAVTPLSRTDVISTSGEVDAPTLPDYSGGEWDPF